MSMLHVEHTHTDLGPTPTASPEDHLRRRLGAPNPCLVGTPWVVGCPVCAESTDQDILGPRLRECQTYTMPTAVYAWLSEYFTTLVSTAACSANRLGYPTIKIFMVKIANKTICMCILPPLSARHFPFQSQSATRMRVDLYLDTLAHQIFPYHHLQ